MNKTRFMTEDQALAVALLNAGIENSEYLCLSNNFDGAYFRIRIWTPYLKYEIYVDAELGEIAGVDTAPVPYQEALCFCGGEEDNLTAAA